MNLIGTLISIGGLFVSPWLRAQPSVSYSAIGVTATGAKTGVGLHQKLKVNLIECQRAVAAGDSVAVSEAAYLIGKRYSGMGDFVTAKYWFMRSLRIREPRGATENLGKLYLRLAELETTQLQFGQALAYARQALATHRQVGSVHGLMSTYVTLSGIYRGQWLASARTADPRSLDKAIDYLRQAEPLAQTLNRPADIAHLQQAFGTVELLRNPGRAILYLKKALLLYDQIGHEYNTAYIRIQLASAHLSLGQIRLARSLIDEARRQYQTRHLTDYGLLDDIETLSARLYQLTGDWKRAFAHQKKAMDIRYAALNAARNGAIEQLTVVYETEQREARIQSQAKELALRAASLTVQHTLNYAMSGLLAVAIGAGLVFFRLNRKNRRISRQNASLVKEQSHRIKNNLQAVSSLLSLQSVRLSDGIAKRAVEDSQFRVQAIALLHRQLYDRDDQLVDVDLRQYIPAVVSGVLAGYGLTHIRPVYELAPVHLHADKVLPMGLILNEVVTNACKYALSSPVNPSIHIGVTVRDGILQLVVTDNGPGFTMPAPSTVSTTYGLRLIQLQTRQLHGSYQFTNQKGTHFALAFPVTDV
ncbi:sensor histidine kinase [Spirosoma utsteinense]|uniref:histidine kinase n=1 Tax=Spirosoma utsteinense TaxID=2585773 RepID=A0ABR6WBN0_9BACT|nr:histidine kinase dimerization/phosphoacceptor domain -containing protein [Spirosoma utsteinense]MBC3783863.1 two-component sensor histidine kinase [Spirosoma utsteinense]MBC3793558.1 two-component sensor histidine kinase [Spirosoma utsteinense]